MTCSKNKNNKTNEKNLNEMYRDLKKKSKTFFNMLIIGDSTT